MGYTKPTETTKQFLEQSPLPKHGSSYTVIPHKAVIKHTYDLLTSNGFMVEKELYRANMNAQVAQGIYYIKPIPQIFDLYSAEVKEEQEMGMMFAWTNSYDKSTRFQCAIGGYVMCCWNGLVCGDMATFARKHTGNADQEVHAQISSQIKSAHKYFKRLVTDKSSLTNINLSVQEQAELVGRLFLEKKLLNVEQLSCVRSEMNNYGSKDSYDYNADKDSAWVFYNHVTHAFKKTHPRTWMSDQQKFHEFMVADVIGKLGIQNQDTAKPITDFEADQDYENIKEDENYKAIEDEKDASPELAEKIVNAIPGKNSDTFNLKINENDTGHWARTEAEDLSTPEENEIDFTSDDEDGFVL
ncbi:MAG: hypothetical protein CMH79_05135 [Nitrospinae bacterium]|nr:hypothetical protein [Nitrospinota bacterium]